MQLSTAVSKTRQAEGSTTGEHRTPSILHTLSAIDVTADIAVTFLSRHQVCFLMKEDTVVIGVKESGVSALVLSRLLSLFKKKKMFNGGRRGGSAVRSTCLLFNRKDPSSDLSTTL